MAKREIECYKYSELKPYSQAVAMENCEFVFDDVLGYNKELLTKDYNERLVALQNQVVEAGKEIENLKAKIKITEKMVIEVFHCQCNLGYVMEDLEKANEETMLFDKNGEWINGTVDINHKIKLRNLF